MKSATYKGYCCRRKEMGDLIFKNKFYLSFCIYRSEKIRCSLSSSDGRDGDLRYFGRTEQKQRNYRRVHIAVGNESHLGKPLSEVASVPRKLTHTSFTYYTGNHKKRRKCHMSVYSHHVPTRRTETCSVRNLHHFSWAVYENWYNR